jgi:hypothetical protein
MAKEMENINLIYLGILNTFIYLCYEKYIISPKKSERGSGRSNNGTQYRHQRTA